MGLSQEKRSCRTSAQESFAEGTSDLTCRRELGVVIDISEAGAPRQIVEFDRSEPLLKTLTDSLPSFTQHPGPHAGYAALKGSSGSEAEVRCR